MPRQARPLQERGVDVKCYIPFKLKAWGESQRLNFSHVLAGTLERMIKGDQSGQTIMDLQEIEYHKTRIAELENGISVRTGKSAQEIAIEMPKTIQDEERQNYLELYNGMSQVHRDILRGIAQGIPSRKGQVINWLQSRAKDFKIYISEDKIVEKLLEFKFWESPEARK